MQGIEEDQGYQSTEDDFHLTTSDEFVDGGHRARRGHRAGYRGLGHGLQGAVPILEELDLEELKLWDEEEAQLQWDINGIYPLVNCYILEWKISIFNGKIYYFYGHFQWDINGIYPLVNCYILEWKISIFNGKIHYFYGHFQWDINGILMGFNGILMGYTLWWTVTFWNGKSSFLMGKSTISMAIFNGILMGYEWDSMGY